ncbi:MAG: hypothetical protein IKM95_07900, partial [Bacteroidales bacterium]|nr:hypothetical protein [Bacteroidales bacterium]
LRYVFHCSLLFEVGPGPPGPSRLGLLYAGLKLSKNSLPASPFPSLRFVVESGCKITAFSDTRNTFSIFFFLIFFAR